MARLEGKQRVQILTVDPEQRLVEGQLRDGVPISIAVWETSAAFRWPRVGEMWSVNYTGGYPILGDRIQDRTEDFRIEDIHQGEMFLDTEQIYDAKAQRVIAVSGNLNDGQPAVYSSALDAFQLTSGFPVEFQPGFMQLTAGAVAPTGWLLCDGTEKAIATFPALAVVCGTTYGALTNGSGGAGTTHFRIPDMQGRTPVGVGTAVGATGATAHTLGQKAGEETHLLTSAESGMPSHNHTQNAHSHTTKINVGTLDGVVAGSSTYNVDNSGADSTSSVTATNIAASAVNASNNHNNMQPYLGLNYLIKT